VRREGPGAGRSDDSSFLDKRVPAINFFTGFHPDYHRPTDDWERIDARGTARVASLALEFARASPSDTNAPQFRPKRSLTNTPASDDAGEARGEHAQAFAQHQPSSVQPRLQRLILQCSRVLPLRLTGPGCRGAERLAVDLGQLRDRGGHRFAKLEPQELFIRHARPIGWLPGVRRSSPVRMPTASVRSRSTSAARAWRLVRSRDIAVLNVIR
jgi:hypothetical protein